MNDDALGPVASIFVLAGVLVGALLVAGVAMYVTDYAVEATVVDKDCNLLSPAADSDVTVRTKLLSAEHTVTIADNVCNILRAGDDGNFVRHHIRTGRTILYEHEGGRCLWDSGRPVGHC